MDVRRLWSRLLSLALPGRVTLVDDTGPVQLVQAKLGPPGAGGALRLFDKLPVLGRYGFGSNPPIGTDLLVFFLEGDPAKGIVVGQNHQASRKKGLQPGDSIQYDVRGAYLWFTAQGPVLDAGGHDVVIQNAATVTVKAATKVRIEAPKIECTGDVVAQCDGTAVSLKGVHDAYNAHKHVDPQGGVTGGTDHPA